MNRRTTYASRPTIWIATIVSLLSSSGAFALSPGLRISQFVHESWTTTEGLPQDSVNAIVQTPDGYLWLATQEGIARFDGVEFTIFDSRTTRGVVGNFVYDLAVDHDGTLWAGSAGGLLRYEGNGAFASVTSDRRDWPGVAARFITADSRGTLWLSFGNDSDSEGKGLRSMTGSTIHTFTREDGLPHDQVYETMIDAAGRLWVGTRAGVAVRNGPRFSTVSAPALYGQNVRALVDAADGTVWAGTSRGLVSWRDGSSRTWTRKDGLRDEEVTSLFIDRDHSLWIGTAAGLHRMSDGRIEPATEEPFATDRILSIFEDREGALWIGTHNHGLHRLREGKVLPYGPPEGLVGKSVGAITQTRSGAIWIGTKPGGVTIARDGVLTPLEANTNAPIKSVTSLFEDRDESMWVGSHRGLFHLQSTRLSRYDERDGLLSSDIKAIYRDRAGVLWISTARGLHRQSGRRFMRADLGPSTPEIVRVFHESRDGRFWIGGADGFGRVERGVYVPFTAGIPADVHVMAISEDADGQLWLATWNFGLFRIAHDRATHFGTAHGLYDDSAWSVLPDRRGSLWLGTNRGIYRIALRDLVRCERGCSSAIPYTLFGVSEGMRKRETNAGSPSAIRDAEGKLWFGTTDGVVVIDPSHLPRNPLPPTVVIERIVVDDVAHRSDDALVLPAGSRRIEFEFAGLSLTAPERVRYRYFLEGFDAGWSNPADRRRASYTGLPPGSYVFRVRASNNDGVWSPVGATAPITLRPRLYQTAAFRMAGTALIVAALFGLRWLRRRQKLIRHQGLHDQLTGLPNRTLLTQRIAVAISQARRQQRSVAILFLDLDGFKSVNDRLGHAAGDRLLQLVAMRFSGCIRDIDTLARIGGDEFAVLVADISNEDRAIHVAERIIAATDRDFGFDAHRVRLGVSVGIALHPFDGSDGDTLLKAADRAMYRAKLAGGRRYHFNAADRDETVTLDGTNDPQETT